MLSQLIARIFGRHSCIGTGASPKSRRRTPRRRGREFVFEPLESRLLLSGDPMGLAAMATSADVPGPAAIVWVNRGTAGDNFVSVFGANAPAARAVVDAAIDSWNRVITNFNYSDGSNVFALTLSMAGSGTGTGASAGFPSNIIGGKPQAGSITIGRGNDTNADGDGDGAGFFIDPTPTESSEFMGNITNAFALDATGGGPAAGLSDLYTVTLLELTHEMGITSAGGVRYQTGGFLFNTGVTDPAGNGSGFFWTFTGPSITALMTSFDSGGGGTNFGPGVHTAEGGVGETFGGLFGSEDAANAFFEFGRRYLVSNKDALILKDAYDYSIVMPETYGTAYSILNQSTGLVTVRGGAGASADNISITRDGGDIVVSVDLGIDVVGLGPTDAFVTRYATGEVVSISILAGDGNDNVTIGAGLGVIPLSADGQGGNDTLITESDVTLIGGAGDDYLYGSTGNDTLTGGAGNDTIYGLAGNDTISGDGDNDQIYAGTGNNVVSDGSGNDFVDLSENSVGVIYTTGGGNDTVIGTLLADVLTGSGGNDRLEGLVGNDTLVGAGGNDTLLGGDDSDTFTWNPGDGSDLIEGGTGNDVLVFNGSVAAEVFTLSAVGTRLELLRNPGGIDMDLAGVEQVNLNASTGADTATINDLSATDVKVVSVDLGAGDADSVTVNGRDVADNLIAANSFAGVSVSGLSYGVNVSGATTADTLIVNGNDGNDTLKAVAPVELTIGITLNGGNGDDFLSADATLLGGAGNDTLIGGAGNDTLDGGDGDDLLDGRGGSNTLVGGSGTDTILVSGTAGADTITTTHAAGTFNVAGGLSAGSNTIATIEAVRIEAGDGSDTINVNLLAAGGLQYEVRGGNPIGAVGDLLALASAGATVTITPGPESDAGSLGANTTAPTLVSYDEIEAISITGGPAVIFGTNGPDAITIIARDLSTHPGTDGIQDFTVALNALPEILFVNTATLMVDAKGGSDEITLIAPAPNNAVWNVAVTIDGGPPAAGGDRVIVQTPVAGAETVSYTPNAADGGLLNLSSLTSMVTLKGIETLTYDGQNDGDSLSVVGSGGTDVIVHTPGANNQSGSLLVNDLLPIAYQNLGAAAALKVDGTGGSDELIVKGTDFNDTFSIALAGTVSLNSRLAIGTTSVETLTLEGLSGDDSFTLVPAISLSPFATINFNGGTQASAGGDRVFLVGTTGSDLITIGGQSIVVGSKTITTGGIESTRLDALGGADQLIYNGVAGLTENIVISSSGEPGGGRLSVAGVTQVDFTGVETIDVNGNVPGPTETDTLAFSGTNAVDIFDINLAAAGIDLDPILRLRNAPLATPLLTLRSYTNFNTLRVNGLDGADTFNVYTSDAGPAPGRNVLIDGGAPTAKRKSTDNLNVYYTPPRPRIIQSAATQNPGSGLVDLAYTNRRFLVQYADMEEVVIARGSIPI